MSFYKVNIFASFPTESLVDPQQPISDYGNVSFYLNTVPGNQTCTISATNVYQITALSITSNGITDGNFNIFPVKFVGEKINFVVQMQSKDGNVKDYPILTLNNFTFLLSSVNLTAPTNYTTMGYIPLSAVGGITENFGSLSTLEQGGFFKGILNLSALNNVSLTALNDVCLVAMLSTGPVIGPTGASVDLVLTGYSTTFTIYPSSGEYNLRKVNEDFNQTDAFKSLAFQPVLIDKTQFFDGFLGQIVGNNTSNPNTLGIEVYEKIANFVSNNGDIDYCNLNQLKSLLDSINATYQDFNYQYPPSLRRLIDILSVKHKNLFGQLNQYQSNFDSKGFSLSPKYGLNKGSFLDINTTIISGGSAVYPANIVAYEKFSQIYTVVNTNLTNVTTYLTGTNSLSTYALSTINNTWGWNLVLPTGVSGVNVGEYYDFYQFVPGIQGTLLQKFIDFDNLSNTLTITNSSYNSYVIKGGIMDNILLYSLYTGLEVLS